MRYLFCPLASQGFVYPAIGIALKLRQRGHNVAFATAPTFNETFYQLGFERVPRGATDGPSFQVEHWAIPLAVAIQVKHIEYAIERFAPDVLVGHQLTIGPLIASERHILPVAILGFVNYLWPSRLPDCLPQIASEARLVWRYRDMMKHYNAAREIFRLPPHDAPPEETPLLGNLFMLQSVPTLVADVDKLPACVHFVGSCLWEPAYVDTELTGWLEQAIATNEPLIYVQHGRTFDVPSFWPHLVAALGNQSVRVIAAIGRMDYDPGPIPPNFFVRAHIPQGTVLPYAHAVIATGNTTAVLGALTHGLPSLLIPGGGEQQEVAESCQHAGAAYMLSPYDVTVERLGQTVRDLLDSVELRRAAQILQGAFYQSGGSDRAADLLELLARTRQPILRVEEGQFQTA